MANLPDNVHIELSSSGYVPFSSEDENNPDQFLNKAKRLVRDEILIYRPKAQDGNDFEVYVVWFAKILGNWKALVSTSIADGLYYEVSYDGAKKVAYVDTYGKVRNSPVYDVEDPAEVVHRAKLEEYGTAPW